MTRALLLSASIAALALSAAPAMAAPAYVPGEVIVKPAGGGPARTVAISGDKTVREAIGDLQESPDVDYAVPNYIARASDYTPNDPGFGLQWNLNSRRSGINMPEAWGLARRLGAPGGSGTTVAVLDTGVAYERYGPFRRAPDLRHFARGYDFVDDDRHPNDENGHGTHVAGTVAQTTGNRRGTAGIAYRARIMPVRVLNRYGEGETLAIARGIRYAARHGADVINLSLEFPPFVRPAEIPDVVSALAYARQRGVLVVAAAGNEGYPQVAFPARARYVLAVAATTNRGCQANYSNSGALVDLSAPGGGVDAANSDTPYDAAKCRPDSPGRSILQETFIRSIARFGLPRGYVGTSMAAPHVSGVAALLIASGRLGANPSPDAVEHRLESTARDIGLPGWDARYGWGLLDAAAALR